jgi:hypothetical protein
MDYNALEESWHTGNNSQVASCGVFIKNKASGPLGCPRYRSAMALSSAAGKKIHCQAA